VWILKRAAQLYIAKKYNSVTDKTSSRYLLPKSTKSREITTKFELKQLKVIQGHRS